MTQANAPVAPSGGVAAGQHATPPVAGSTPAAVPPGYVLVPALEYTDINALRQSLDRRNEQQRQQLLVTQAQLEDATRQIDALRQSQEALEDTLATPEERQANQVKRLQTEMAALRARPPFTLPAEVPAPAPPREPTAADVAAKRQAFIAAALQREGLTGQEPGLDLSWQGTKPEVLAAIRTYKAVQQAVQPQTPTAPVTSATPAALNFDAPVELVGYSAEQIARMQGRTVAPAAPPARMPVAVETGGPAGSDGLPPFDRDTIHLLSTMGKKGRAEIERRRDLYARVQGVAS